MANDPYRSGGSEYGAPYAQQPQPSMRPAGANPPAAYPAHVDEPWGKGAPAPPAVATAPAAPAEDPNVVIFSRAYEAHGDEIRRITLRKPVTKEIVKCGNPLKFDTDDVGRIRDIEVKYDVVAKYIPLLSTPPLPPSTVANLEFFDLDACAGVICSFFVKIR